MNTKSKTGFAAACVALVLLATVLPACTPPPTAPPPTAPPPGAATTDVAKWLLEKAGGIAANKGFGFVFSQIGLNSLFPDGTTQQLDQIKRQLDAISQQLNQVQVSLTGLIGGLAQSDLTTQLYALKDQSRDVGVLYNEQFKPLLALATAHQAAKDSGDQQRIDSTFASLIRARNEFYTAYDRLNASALAGRISDRLIPGPGTSALAAQGRVLLTRPGGRYLTSADSAKIRALYDNFAEYEALAAWMRMERWIPSDPPPPEGTKPGNLENYDNARKEYLDQTRQEHAGLPPVIPADVVVDVGPSGTTTNGATMWKPVASDVRYRPDNRDAGTVPVLLDSLNADPSHSYGDWTIPSRADLSSLLSGSTPTTGSTLDGFLAGLNPSSAAWRTIANAPAWPYIWARDVITFNGSCMRHVNNSPISHYSVKLQNAVGTSTATPAWGGRPALPSTAYEEKGTGRVPNCSNFLAATFAGPTAVGGFLASRTVTADLSSPNAVDYAAQGSAPYVRAAADLRFADLSGRYLAGLDLHGVDLRGATLTGADLSGTNLMAADLSGATLIGTDLSGAIMSGAELTGATLKDVNLSGTRLDGAHLTGVASSGIVGQPKYLPNNLWTLTNGYLVGPGAVLTDADLHGADLSKASLDGVTSGGVDCTDCILPTGWVWSGLPSGYLVNRTANLKGASLVGIDLHGMDLTGADLTGADLTRANLAGADLTGANVTGARFVGADLTGVRLAKANLTGSSMERALLKGVSSGDLVATTPVTLPTGWRLVNGYLAGPGASLFNANLDNANLAGADLTGADLTRSFLIRADLTGATLIDATLTGATVTGARFGTDDDNKLAGIVSGGVIGVPAQMPASGRFRLVFQYLVGPNVNLSGAYFPSDSQLGVSLSATNFTNAFLSGLNLTGAYLNNANLTKATLTNTTLTGANLSAATLAGVVSGGIVGNPVLPAGWKTVGGYLVGPEANLVNARLAGADLTGVNLTGADLTGADLTGARWSHTTCPNGVVQDTPCRIGFGSGSGGAPTVRVWSNRAHDVLRGDVDPDLASGSWSVRIERLAGTGQWVPATSLTTRGPRERWSINLPMGTYRAVVPPQAGNPEASSASVVLSR